MVRLILLLFFFGVLLTPTVALAQIEGPIPQQTEVVLDTSDDWQVRAAQSYSSAVTLTSFTMPVFAIIWSDGRVTTIATSEIEVFSNGQRIPYLNLLLQDKYWKVDLQQPLTTDRIEVRYTIAAGQVAANLQYQPVFIFSETNLARFTWQNTQQDEQIKSFECGLFDFVAVTTDFKTCTQVGSFDTGITLSSQGAVRGESYFIAGVNPAEPTIPPQAQSPDGDAEATAPPTGPLQNLNPVINNAVQVSWVWVIPFSLLISLLVLYVMKENNKTIPEPVITRYKPPKQLTPIQAAYLMKPKVRRRIFLAWLAESFFKEQVVVRKPKLGDPELHDRLWHDDTVRKETLVANMIRYMVFNGQPRLEQPSMIDYLRQIDSTRNGRFWVSLQSLDRLLRLELETFGYMHKKRNVWVVAVIIFFVFVGVVWANSDNAMFYGDPQLVIAGFVSIVLFWLCLMQWPLYTNKGRQMRRKLAGYKQYLRVAEKDRHNKKFLPNLSDQDTQTVILYMIAFGFNVDHFPELEKFLPSQADFIFDGSVL